MLSIRTKDNASLYCAAYFIDIDECVANNAGCEHICNNEAGGYSCSCEGGFMLAPDRHSCYGKVPFEIISYVNFEPRTIIPGPPSILIPIFCGIG